MSETKVMKCNCENDFQDKKYGKQNRLHNITADKMKGRCTVCANTVNLSGASRTSKKK